MKTNNSNKDKVRQLQNKLYLTAKKCSSRRFHALYDKVYREDVLFEAWKRVKANKGSIINAIGMNLNDTFGPAKDKFNIVTEGMSDYIYLSTMAKVLEIDTKKYAIIPAVGASNCINICSILHGWGCRYIAVFDYDGAGVKSGGEYLRKDMMLEFQRQYCYLADVSQQDVDDKTYKTSSVMIEDVVTHEEIERFCDEKSVSKTIGKPLMAKLMSNAIESGTFQIGETCKTNFQSLFDRIFSYCES